MNWLANHLQALPLTEAHEGYFLGRGAQDESIARFGIKSWQPLVDACPDQEFTRRYGPGGDHLAGWAVWPLFSPRGQVVGFEGRPLPEKRVIRHLLPEALWQPLWLGLVPETMQRIWDGCDVWVVEGFFDLFALEWAVPKEDVVLASLRAKLTDKHIEFLRRFCKGWVKMVYDNDEAGQHGVHGFIDKRGKKRWGALQYLSRVEVKATTIRYRGKDPGEIWEQGGAAGVRAAFQ